MNKDSFRFSTSLRVRWRDLDALNHVNNVVYFTYLEEARVGYFAELGLVTTAPSGIGFILAEASCQFKSPLTLGELVTIYARVSDLGDSSFVFEYCVEGEDHRIAARARSTQVCYDYEEKHPILMSDEWRQAIIAYEPGLPS